MSSTPGQPLLQVERTKLNILIADDHSIVRLGLKMLIRNINNGFNIEEATDGESVIDKLKSAPFDLLILDINMPNTESFSLTSYLIKEFPSLKILIFTMNQEVIFAKRFLRLGAHGYLTKQSKEPEINYAIRQIIGGHVYISDHLSQIISDDLVSNKKSNPFEELTDREFEVILQILKGSSISEIAEILHINNSSVGTHKSRIMYKLGLSNTIELLSLARLHNIL